MDVLVRREYAAAAAKSLQSCPTLSDPMDCSLPGSSIHGIFQARVLEWVAIDLSTQGVYIEVFRTNRPCLKLTHQWFRKI